VALGQAGRAAAGAALIGVGAQPLGKLLGDLQLLGREGDLHTDIGGILGLSPRTVEEYLAKACDKLGVRRRIQAVVRARRLGLLDEEP
jgi:hypothetical protein